MHILHIAICTICTICTIICTICRIICKICKMICKIIVQGPYCAYFAYCNMHWHNMHNVHKFNCIYCIFTCIYCIFSCMEALICFLNIQERGRGRLRGVAIQSLPGIINMIPVTGTSTESLSRTLWSIKSTNYDFHPVLISSAA